MKDPVKIIVYIFVALVSFAGYTALFSVLLGTPVSSALSLLKSTAADSLGQQPGNNTGGNSSNLMAVVDSAAVNDSVSNLTQAAMWQAKEDSLKQQVAAIRKEKTELERLRNEISLLLKTKSKADSIQLYNLAKIYEGVDVVQLATVMANMDDSLVIAILPRMKSQKAGKILESMPAERAARISSKLLGLN